MARHMKKEEKITKSMHHTKMSAIHMLAGKWTLHSLKTHQDFSLVITYSGNIYLNDKRLHGEIKEVSHNHLVFTDYYGYQLTFKKSESGIFHLYDELGEQVYTAIRASL